MSTCLPHHLKRECICETMNPGPLLNIRNTFPTTFVTLLYSEIITCSSCIHHTKTQKYIISHCHHHPSLFPPSLHIYLSSLHIYFMFCIHFILISFSHLVLDNHLVSLRAQSNLLCLQVTKRMIGR